MKSIIKFVGIILSFVLVLLVFASCHSASKRRTIILWYHWRGKREDILKKYISLYNKSTHKFLLKGIYMRMSKIEQTLISMPLSKEKYRSSDFPDIVMINHDWIGKLAQEGVITDIDEFITDDIKNSFFDFAMEGVRFGGSFYALPVYYDTIALFYNKRLVKKLPKTFEQMLEMGDRISLAKEGVSGLFFDIYNAYYVFPFFYAFGGGIFEGNILHINRPENIRALKFVRDIFHRESFLGVSPAVGFKYFTDNRVAFMLSGPWVIDKLLDNNINFGVMTIPKIAKTGKYIRTFIGMQSLAITKIAKDKKECFKIISFLTSADMGRELGEDMGIMSCRKEVYNYKQIRENKMINVFKRQTKHGIVIPNNPIMIKLFMEMGYKRLGYIFHADDFEKTAKGVLEYIDLKYEKQY